MKLLVTLLVFFLLPVKVHATVDPLAVPNNPFGIHIITPTPNEIGDASKLVNSSGGSWGYVTIVIEEKNRDIASWRAIFDELAKNHLIPIVRIATQVSGDTWRRPTEEDAFSWASFLSSLNWPTKNRYVIIYNEPNHAKEWGSAVDPKSYAQILNRFIRELKLKSPDFFVLNAGLDASAPHEPPNYFDEIQFLNQMNEAVPGIFDQLDGWVSHSYPNPDFAGSPKDSGRGTVRTYLWELDVLKDIGVTKNFPVFITETGWQHAEGIVYDRSRPPSETVGRFLLEGYQEAWNDPRIVAVTPFLLTYPEPPFDHFSFQNYPQYVMLQTVAKPKGEPVLETHPVTSAPLEKPSLSFWQVVFGYSRKLFSVFPFAQ